MKGLADVIVIPSFGRCGAPEVAQQGEEGGTIPDRSPRPRAGWLRRLIDAEIEADRKAELRQIEWELEALRRATEALEDELDRRRS